MKIVYNFILNLSIINFFFYLLQKIDSGRIWQYSYQNLAEDFEQIGFQYTFTYTYFYYSLFISIFITLISDKFIKLNLSADSLEDILTKTLKISFVNIGITTFSIFFFQLFELLSRVYVLAYFLIYPILFIIIEILFLSLNSRVSKNISRVIASTVIFTAIIYNFNIYNESIINTLNANKITSGDVQNEENIQLDNLFLEETLPNTECSTWLGTGKLKACIGGLEISSFEFEDQVSNIVKFQDNIFYILKEGSVFRQNTLNPNLELFLDISSRVNTDFPGIEQGLFNLAFHPTENYLIATYTNSDIALVAERFELFDNGLPNINNSEVIFKLSNNVRFHFGGSIIWSEYFQGFLLGIGDMRENIMPLGHSDALNTTSFKGKIILLRSDKKISSPLISENGLYPPLDNLVAFGIRNPWQMMEYENKLVFTDIGSQFIEEINIIDYSKYSNEQGLVSTSFGWPLLMGESLSYSFRERNKEAMIRLDGLITDLYHWEASESPKADEYIIEISEGPFLQYDHYVDENTIRAAIIGGDIISDTTSLYKDYYFFTDYVENELYGVDLNDKSLLIFPLPQIGNPTSLRISPFEKDSLLISYTNGKILDIKLP